MKKKTLALSLALGGALIASSLGVSKAFATKAEEEDLTPNFDEDFSSCAIETAEEGDRADLGKKWTNAYFEPTGDFNEGSCAKDQFYVTADPTDSTNKVLRVNTAASNQSFFYLTMKGIYAKDFKITFDLYQTAVNCWTGFNFRKPVDGRYNGVTNVMSIVRAWDADKAGPQFYRSVSDSFMAVDATGPDGTTEALSYTSDNFADFAGSNNTWVHVEITAIGDDFTLSINNHLLGKATIAKKTARSYGYVSLVSCVSDAYYDNIHLENLDEVPYTPDSSEEQTGHQAPTMAENSFEVNLGEDATIPVNLYGEAITTLKQGKNEVLNQYYSVDGDTLTLSKDYLAKLGAGRWNFVLTTAGGSVGFVVSVVDSASSEAPVTSSETASASSSEPAKPDSGSKGGCGGEIIGTSLVALAALAGVGVIALKRRKDDK